MVCFVKRDQSIIALRVEGAWFRRWLGRRWRRGWLRSGWRIGLHPDTAGCQGEREHDTEERRRHHQRSIPLNWYEVDSGIGRYQESHDVDFDRATFTDRIHLLVGLSLDVHQVRIAFQ